MREGESRTAPTSKHRASTASERFVGGGTSAAANPAVSISDSPIVQPNSLSFPATSPASLFHCASWLTVEFDREDDGRWLAEVPELGGVMAYGRSPQEAAAAAAALALRVLAERVTHGEAEAGSAGVWFASM